VKVGFYADGKRTDIAVKPNEKTLTYDGTMTAPSSATFIVHGCASSANLGDDPRRTKTDNEEDRGRNQPL